MTEKIPKALQGAKRTLKITVQYDGTNYIGWQRQAKGESIQGVLEKAIGKVASQKITLYGAGRTDAGVHALGQVASFSLKRITPKPEAFVEGVNSILPRNIRILKAEEVDLQFLANRDSREKSYRYFIENTAIPTVFLRPYSWHVKWPLDFFLMNEAAEHLIGEHDFLGFQGSQADTKTSIRTVYSAKWTKGISSLWQFEIRANGFLKYMVRNIVGTLVEVGLKKKTPEDVITILEKKKRILAGVKAPAQGLFLWSVEC